MYLGMKMNIESVDSLNDTELGNRLSSGWRKFWSLRRELTLKSCSLQRCLKLFDSCVSPCVLCGAGTWTLTEGRRRRLQTTQRKMLRIIVDTKRVLDSNDKKGVSSESDDSSDDSCQLENWIEYIKRATHTAEDSRERYGIVDWVSIHYESKCRLAGHVGRRTDGRWSRKILYWMPADGHRMQGHPCKRWTDSLDAFFKAAHGMKPGEWLKLCVDRHAWKSLSSVFVSFCCGTQ